VNILFVINAGHSKTVMAQEFFAHTLDIRELLQVVLINHLPDLCQLLLHIFTHFPVIDSNVTFIITTGRVFSEKKVMVCPPPDTVELEPVPPRRDSAMKCSKCSNPMAK